MSANSPILDRLVDPLSACMNVDALKRIVSLKADQKIQSRVNALARKNSAGTITEVEKNEYANYVAFGSFIAILQSKARKQLAKSSGE